MHMMPLSTDTKHTHSNLAGVVIKKPQSVYLCNSVVDKMTFNETEMSRTHIQSQHRDPWPIFE
jgi:hypothetical protein